MRALLLLAFTFCTVTVAVAMGANPLRNGNDLSLRTLAQECAKRVGDDVTLDFCSGYILGLINGLNYPTRRLGEPTYCPRNVPFSKQLAAVREFLVAHPNLYSVHFFNAQGMVTHALATIFPCPGQRPVIKPETNDE